MMDKITEKLLREIGGSPMKFYVNKDKLIDYYQAKMKLLENENKTLRIELRDEIKKNRLLMEGMAEINYKELLDKYINFIEDVEGYNFIDYYPSHASNIKFTEDEIKYLENNK